MSHRISLRSPNRAGLGLLIALIVGAAACGRDRPAEPPPGVVNGTTADATTNAGHDDHVHEPPHGGTLIEIGDHFAHLELLFDTGAGSLTAWVLDEEAEGAIRVVQPTMAVVLDAPASLANRPLELEARTNALTGERVGDASEFVLTHEGLRGLDHLSGRVLELTVRGLTVRDVPLDVPAGAQP